MANIRFVKPPPDNRIRSFPYTPTQHSLNECEVSTHLEPSKTLHITTPKRRKNYLPHWDIFITSRPDTNTITSPTAPTEGSVDSNKGKTLQNNKEIKRTSRELPIATMQKTEETVQNNPDFDSNARCDKGNDFTQSFASVHDVTPSVTDTSELNAADCISGRLGDASSQGSKGDSDRATPVMPFLDSCQNDALSSPVSHGWVGQQRQSTDCLRTNPKTQTVPSKQNAVNTRMIVGLSEVLEEEVASLPEVRDPTGCVSPEDGQLLEQTRPCSQEKSGQKLQYQQISSLQGQENVGKNCQSDNMQRNTSKLSLIVLPRRPYPMGPLRRSISEYDFNYENPVDDDEEEDVSFFSRVRNSKKSKPKRPNLQETRADSFDKSTGHENIGGQRVFPKFAWAEGTVLNSSFFGGSDLVLSCKDKFALKDGRTSASSSDSNTDSGDLSKSLTPIQQFVSPDTMRRPSRESVYSARLAKRRFALADPERMIISQEMREKLERDVQRRKSSTVRKVSQFFNIQLGLNKEEDLI
ncbi:hypothetical protein RRG08_025737 [Elysia crispata]|uniref:Uncharacterized protein n=1 Tax=Elysia crispata TaxID=231223 RepID=A0AAE1AGE5_9GAST|nr:hypothetical protein RRG08_025737 [Elysia crispata]